MEQKSHQPSHDPTAFSLHLSKYPLLHPPLKGLEVMTAKVDFSWQPMMLPNFDRFPIPYPPP